MKKKYQCENCGKVLTMNVPSPGSNTFMSKCTSSDCDGSGERVFHAIKEEENNDRGVTAG